ncbi:restriction endonuclease subunit S [Kosakonia cowanii]|uniref:restriction endonuclease subunit S n=1 Tax=Kosakonia cowanii TaxID=208223 RepID=UPI003D25CD8A
MTSKLLPESWEIAILENISNFIDYRGKTPKKTISGVPLITAKNIRNGFIKVEPQEFISEDDYDSWMTRGIPNFGDIVITTEAPLGNVALLNIREKIALAQRAICIQPFNPHMNSYIHYALRSPAFQKELTNNATGTTVSGIKASTLKKLCLPLPSLNEQKIIAEKLDTLLAQVDSIKARLEQIPQILKRFRQAVLGAAVNGNLTVDLRNSQNLIDWHNTNLGALIVDSCNGLAKRKGLNGNEVTILRLADFKDAQRINGNERKIKLESKEQNKYSLKDNDILVIRVNGSADLAGRFIEYKSNGDTEGFCDHFIRLRLDSNQIISRFLTYIANDGEGRFYLRNSLSTSAGQNTINQTSIKGLSFLLPPLSEQAEIVRRVEQLFAYADTIEKQVNNALARVNNLTQSILAKAFRGELTAQWRAENPDLISGENSAAALLEKIKAERAASGGKKSSRKKS